MKRQIIFIMIGLIFASFKHHIPSDCIKDLFFTTDKELANKYEKVESKNEFGIRHSIDSINYSIIRRWKDDMTPIVESISNELTNIDFWNDYHENGQLKEVGFMTSTNHSKIGKWKYFSDSGQLDSIVDYDKRYKVSYCDFYELAQGRGLTGRTSEIEFNNEQRKWRIAKWDYAEDSASAIGIELQVDSMKIEDIELTRIY